MAKTTTKKPATAKPKAKRATAKKASAGTAKAKAKPKAKPKTKPKADPGAGHEQARERSSASKAVVQLLESPLVADLLAVGASAALAALAEHKFSRSKQQTGGKQAIKGAASAAAAAMGRRLGEEFSEIRKASAEAKAREGD